MGNNKKSTFDSYYCNSISQLKWFEPFIQPQILEEWNKKNIRKGMDLLDIGGGCSLDSIFFASKGINTVVLDFSQNALNKMKKLSDFFGVEIQYENSSILDLPHKMNGKFDVLSDNGCFHHIEPQDRNKYIRSVSNAIKPNGVMYIRAISDYEGPSRNKNLSAYRISSDDIVRSKFMETFKLEEMSLFDYVLNDSGRQKMWFIKLRRR